MDVGDAVNEIKRGKVEFKIDKNGVINLGVGKLSFLAKSLTENIRTLLMAILRAKPASAKGTYIESLIVSSTMGPGLKVDQREIPTVKG